MSRLSAQKLLFIALLVAIAFVACSAAGGSKKPSSAAKPVSSSKATAGKLNGKFDSKAAAAAATANCNKPEAKSCSGSARGCCTDLVNKALVAGGYGGKDPFSRGAAEMKNQLIKAGWKSVKCNGTQNKPGNCVPGQVLYYPNLNKGQGHVAMCDSSGKRSQWNPPRCSVSHTWPGKDGIVECLNPPA